MAGGGGGGVNSILVKTFSLLLSWLSSQSVCVCQMGKKEKGLNLL